MAVSPIATSPARPQLNGDAIRVLIIDDDRCHAEAVAESLERVGYDCTVATSGAEGARLHRDATTATSSSPT